MEYETNNDELYHWKYIKRIKDKKGKWKYFYDQEEIKKYEQNERENKKVVDKNGKVIENKHFYTDTDKLFDRKTTYKTRDGVNTSHERGKLSRFAAKGEKYIFDKLPKNKKATAKDRRKNPYTDKNPYKPRYVMRVKLPNGKYRYYYDDSYKKDPNYFMKDVKRLPENSKMTDDEHMAAVNPKYDPEDPRYSTNCLRCSMTYELRKRGYDVSASEYRDGQDIYYSERVFNDPVQYRITPNGDVVDIDDGIDKETYENFNYNKDDKYQRGSIQWALKKNNPRNSRGIINVAWRGLDSSHSLIYEVDKNGKVILRDCQTNDKVSPIKLAGEVSYAEFFRTDNLELQPEVLNVIEY